ncbi:MAG: hypothetical protein H7259_09785 [Cytophagales bacterium]|nr:hypothetical protein [Cytophaga sp.]
MFQKSIRLLSISLFFIVYHSSGQNYFNYVSRYAQSGVYGTARMQALGGCGVALGADLSSASMNPGGLGMYNKSDIGGSFSVGLATSNSAYTTQYQTMDTRDSRGWFSIPNLGVSFYNVARNPNSAFKGGSFAVTFNKTANFQNQIGYSGTSTNDNQTMINSFADYMNRDQYAASDIASDANYVNGTVYSYSSLYYYSNLITNNGSYLSNFPLPSTGAPFQNQGNVATRKGQYHWDIAYGANILNKLYIGASIGISILNYKFESQHKETVVPDPGHPNNLISFEYDDYDQQKAAGINLKVGGIYKISDRFRIAGTILTPTSQMIKETYSSTLNSQYLTPGSPVNKTLQVSPYFYKYRYLAPPKFEAGATYVFGKSGLITGGVEYIPYTWASLKDPQDVTAFQIDNKIIKDSYRNTINVKGGLELRNGTYYYRVGGAYMPDPYKATFDDVNRDQWNITAGWGIRTSTFYFDIAAVNTRFKGIYKPYVLNNGQEPYANYKSSIVQFTVTAGILY